MYIGCTSWHEENCEGGGADRRIGHTVTYDPDKKLLYVYGGSKNKRWFSDVNILDLQKHTWSAVKVSDQIISSNALNSVSSNFLAPRGWLKKCGKAKFFLTNF